MTATTVVDRVPAGIISADSHITEPPDCYTKYIDPKYRDEAPKIITHETKGDLFIIPGMKPIAIAPLSSAGIPSDQLKFFGKTFEDLHRSGWDGTARAADQERDGLRGGGVRGVGVWRRFLRSDACGARD